MKDKNKDTKLGFVHDRARFARTCRRIALGLWGATALFLAAALPQAWAGSPVEVTNFGSNPGNLKMFKYIPAQLSTPAPLVVVMHGCTQNARDFADESGWIRLADKLGLAMVLPEQQSSNNSKNCFNWFQQGDNSRDQGEALSIKQMIDKMKADHNIDPKRVFVTGLSAGGAMTSVMLATYPEIFAGGGIVAGLPYGCANDPPQMFPTQAFQCMSTGHPSGGVSFGLPGGLPGPGLPALTMPAGMCLMFPLPPPLCPAPSSAGGSTFTAAGLGDLVRQASHHTGPFPKVSIWHGSNDTTVSPINASEEMQQWTNVHGIASAPAVQDTIKGYAHQIFKDASGNAVVETFSITGMAHGDPVDPGPGADQCGTAAPFVINAQICSSLFIAKFWGLAP
jgi:poly(hydroxyalkanoate) depolymerase family esterase